MSSGVMTVKDGTQIYYKDWGHRTTDRVPPRFVPIADSGLLAARLLRRGTLKVYPGLSHGMCTTHSELINCDLLAFIKGQPIAAPTELERGAA